MMNMRTFVKNACRFVSPAIAIVVVFCASASAREQWTIEQAGAWGLKAPWLVGCNFSPSTAINQLEMWQAETFDPVTIDRELGLAESLGFNSVRVFLHHIPYVQDSEGFLKRIDKFLEIADKHKIGAMFVLLDSVWDPHPRAGKQREPKPGLHNSGWVQCPGIEILRDPARHVELKPYIQGVVGRFANDRRVQVWDLFNEPDNENGNSYGKIELRNKHEYALKLIEKAYAWALEVNPAQPITSGVWTGDLSRDDKLSPINRFMLERSDIISYHNYAKLPDMKNAVESLKRFRRPLVCTEYMARPAGSTFDPILGYLKHERVGAYNWGFVAGKTQTIYPWDSWQKPYSAEPKIWFHDIFRQDGTPFDPREVSYIKRITGKQ